MIIGIRELSRKGMSRKTLLIKLKDQSVEILRLLECFTIPKTLKVLEQD